MAAAAGMHSWFQYLAPPRRTQSCCRNACSAYHIFKNSTSVLRGANGSIGIAMAMVPIDAPYVHQDASHDHIQHHLKLPCSWPKLPTSQPPPPKTRLGQLATFESGISGATIWSPYCLWYSGLAIAFNRPFNQATCTLIPSWFSFSQDCPSHPIAG